MCSLRANPWHCCLPVFPLEQTPFFTLLSSLGLRPSPSLPEHKADGLRSLCPFLAVHLLATLALRLSFRVPPEGSPCPWAGCRGASFPVPGTSPLTFLTVLFMAPPPYILQVAPKHHILTTLPYVFSPWSVVFKHTKPSAPFCGRHFSLSACFPLSSGPTFLTASWTPPAGYPVNNQT